MRLVAERSLAWHLSFHAQYITPPRYIYWLLLVSGTSEQAADPSGGGDQPLWVYFLPATFLFDRWEEPRHYNDQAARREQT